MRKLITWEILILFKGVKQKNGRITLKMDGVTLCSQSEFFLLKKLA